MSRLLFDLRLSLRMLRKTPVFAVVAIASLALGIGANTAIFTLFDQVLLRALPVGDPQSLVMLDGPGPDIGSLRNANAFSFPVYRDFRDHAQVFSGIFARFGAAVSVTQGETTERANAELVTGQYFQTLGIGAIRGRVLKSEDDRQRGGNPLAVLSFSFWQRRFGGRPSVLNSKILVNGHPFMVIGIAPFGFNGTEVGDPVDLFVPMSMKAQITPTWDDMENRRSKWLNVFGRLKQGVTPETARAEVQKIYTGINRQELETFSEGSGQFRKRFAAKQVMLLPAAAGRSQLRQTFRQPLFILMAMVGLVLLIACANVANLLIARAAARQRDLAIRLAIGASRWAIARQLFMESILLAFLGGAFALLVSVWAAELLLAFLPFEGARLAFSTSPDLRVLAFNFGVSLLAGLLFGLFPALQLARHALASTLKNEAGSISEGSGQVRARKALVVAQVALSLLLLIGAGLFTRSLLNLRSLDPGFNVANVTTFSLDAALNGYGKERLLAAYEQLRERLQSVPGVQRASYTDFAVLSGDLWQATIAIEGHPRKEGENTNMLVSGISANYLRTLQMPLVNGREFTDSDNLKSPKTGLISESVAKKFFPGRNPIGMHFGFGTKKPDIGIVGIVKDRRNSVRELSPLWVYVPFSQGWEPSSAAFYVRSALRPAQVAEIVRREVRSLDANMPVFRLRSLKQQVDENLFVDRAIALLSAFFGLLATVLAAIGLYGVMAYTVTRRTREIGIRIALGAERVQVLWLVLREVAILAAIGIAIGLPVSLSLSGLVRSQLYGLEPADPLTLGVATVSLSAVAFLAGYLPAARASRIDPLRALRYE